MEFENLDIMHGKQLLSQSQKGPFSKKQGINLIECSSIDLKPACENCQMEAVIEKERIRPEKLIKSQIISSRFC